MIYHCQVIPQLAVIINASSDYCNALWLYSLKPFEIYSRLHAHKSYDILKLDKFTKSLNRLYNLAFLLIREVETIIPKGLMPTLIC